MSKVFTSKVPTSSTAPYMAWGRMKYMCNTDNPIFKPDYKDKGISYEANFAWFEKFWLATRHGWCKGAKLARKDTTKWFTESNCYWKPPKGQKPYPKAKCATGVWGLKLFVDRNGYASYVVRLTDETGRRVSKFWSIDKYGDTLAFMLAAEYIRDNRGVKANNSK